MTGDHDANTLRSRMATVEAALASLRDRVASAADAIVKGDHETELDSLSQDLQRQIDELRDLMRMVKSAP